MSMSIESKIYLSDFMFVFLAAGIISVVIGFWLSNGNKDENNKTIDETKEIITIILKIVGFVLIFFSIIRLWFIYKSLDRKVLPGK